MSFRTSWRAAGWLGLWLGTSGSAFSAVDDPPAAGREIPAALAPFEYLVGSWKGTGVPTANRIRGWPETHAWAWKFDRGIPVGMSLTITGGKVLTSARLSHDAATRLYTLSGTGLDGKPLTFRGGLDPTGKQLNLDRVGLTSGGADQRLTLYPNANSIRYTLRVSEREPGAPQFRPTLEVGVTREGEAFAAGAGATDLAKCIVTGGAATMTVTYQGKSFPLCCTGCRDEFNDNPEKYIKKAAERAAAVGAVPVKAATSGKDDGSFDGVVDAPRDKPAADPRAKPEAPRPAPTSKSAARVEPSRKEVGKGAERAAKALSLLRIGQNLEKSGKTAAAVGYYRQIVKDYAGTPAAVTAAARLKTLAPR